MAGKITRILFNGRVRDSVALPCLKLEDIESQYETKRSAKYKLAKGNTISNKAYCNIDIIKIVSIIIE